MRLIDADELKKPVGSYNPVKFTWEFGDVISVLDIDNAPTIDPVQHGHWVEITDIDAPPRCSNCGRIRFGSSCGYAMKYVPYCEKCGAKMDETQKKPCDYCQEFDCYGCEYAGRKENEQVD